MPTIKLAGIGTFFYYLAPLRANSTFGRHGSGGPTSAIAPASTMPHKVNNLFGKLATCAVIAACSGCSVPWTMPFNRRSESAAVPAATINRAERDGQAPAASGEHTEPTTTAAADEPSDPNLSGVLDKLEEIRAMDPAAEQQLRAELRNTPARSWPLVAEQFRASVAYREQLAAKRRASPGGTARIESTTEIDEGAPNRSTTGLLLHTRPSAPIGKLVDPREADADGISSEALARATPYSLPVAGQGTTHPEVRQDIPAEFAVDGPSHPIRSQPTADDFPTDGDQAVVQARFQARESSFDPSAAVPDDKGRLGDPRRGDDWRELVELAADDLSGRVAASPTTTAEVHQHVSLRILHLLAGDTESALKPIPHIQPSEQDYWSRQLFALATYMDHHSQPDEKRRAAASVIHLDQAVSSLRELGSLSLRGLAFCKNVYGYGATEPYPEDRFVPGQQVTMYVEVENYHSSVTEKGYRTALGSSYEIVTEDGTRVTGGEIPDVEDLCRTRRRDFHIQYGLTLPDTIAPGNYRLQLVIKDRQSEKIGHASAAFEIRGVGR